MMSIVRCPYCGKATVAVRGRAPKSACTRCGRSLANVPKLAKTDGSSLTKRVREHLHRQQGLSRSR